jgi:hypothetical protein
VPFAYINNFCQSFIPEQARHAPERGTAFQAPYHHRVSDIPLYAQ